MNNQETIEIPPVFWVYMPCGVCKTKAQFNYTRIEDGLKLKEQCGNCGNVRIWALKIDNDLSLDSNVRATWMFESGENPTVKISEF